MDQLPCSLIQIHQSELMILNFEWEMLVFFCYKNIINNSYHSGIQLMQQNLDQWLIWLDEIELEFWLFRQKDQMQDTHYVLFILVEVLSPPM